MEKDKPRLTSLLLTQNAKVRLERLARKFRYYQTRGPGVGETGSISALLEAIARGKLQVKSTDTDAALRHSPPTKEEEVGQLDDGERLDTAQASAKLGVSIRTVQKYAKEGTLRARRFGRHDWSIRPRDLGEFKRWLEAKRRKTKRHQ